MKRLRTAIVVACAALWLACSDQTPRSLTGPADQPQLQVQGGLQGIATAMTAQEQHMSELMRISGVVGTAVGLSAGGRPVIRVFLERAGVSRIPAALDGVPVATEISGPFMARSDPTTRQRPAPPGYSVGHPSITAGTIGARVRDAAGHVYVLSNNHVLANSNNASIGDPTLQPGPYDGGTYPADQIATLSAFQTIDFAFGPNTIDAAIAQSSTANLSNSTPLDDAYGIPNSTIFGDANHDGTFDNKNALLGLNVMKYGRTTGLTHGQITGINGSFLVCYATQGNSCSKYAYFVDQLVIGGGTFSGGGDSGSLIVTDDGNKNPVALLFAGSSSQTIANRIDLVLNHFGVTVDGGEAPPPTPTTDVAVSAIDAPSSVTQGNTVDVMVTVTNVGNQDVATSFDVTLKDTTENLTIGTQTVPGLAAGANTTLTYSWNTTGSAAGSHTLIARHSLADDDAGNNVKTAAVTVSVPGAPGTMHIGDLDGSSSNDGKTWSAVVEITVHDPDHHLLNGATVVGSWSESGLNADTCTTGELGGNGTCIVLFPALRKNVRSVRFTVTSVTLAGVTYQAGDNHDPDGDSNGTTITVNKP